MKTKKIFSIVIVSVIFVLACLVVVSAIVPKSYSFGLAEPQSITIKSNNQTIEKNDERFATIMEKFNSGFDVKFIEAFFQGKGFQGVSTVSNTTYLESSSLTNGDKVLIEFKYGTDQNTNLNGANISLANNEKTYRSVVIEIVNSENLTKINAYLKYNTSDSTSHIAYVTYAKHSDLFKYLSENFN